MVFRGERGREIHHHQSEVRIGHRLKAAFDAERLYQPFAFANASGIEQLHGDTMDGRGFRHNVTRGAGNIGDDRAILLEQAVEQTALAHIGPAHNGQREAFAHQSAIRKTLRQSLDAGHDRLQTVQNLACRRDTDIVLREVDARFEQCDQFQELVFERSDPARDGATHLLRGNARLIERSRVDQIPHRFRLRQINAPVQECAQREFAGFGQPRATFERARYRMPQNHRGAMAGDLDQIFGCIRARPGKERHYHLIHGLAGCVDQFRQLAGPGFPVAAGWKSQQVAGDFAGSRT